MRNRLDKTQGITLIALVVTIIVLLVLAGVSISMLTGENGILKRAAEAKEKTNESQDLEYLKLKATEALMDYYQKNTTESEDEYILDKWDADKTNKIDVHTADKTITYNGKVYAISDIVGNESEKKKITENSLKQITVSNVENEEDKKILSNGKVRIIVEEENGMRAAIPNGFYYVIGKPSTGLVISDRYGDDDKNTKGGNQFVWIPCSEDTTATSSNTNGTEVTYEKVNGLATTWKKHYSNKQWYYTNVPADRNNNVGKEIVDWKDDGGDLDSVKKYKGFYIARYEAGLPADENLWSWQNDAKYGWTNGKNPGDTEGERNSNISKMTPVSKKNNASWNRVSQVNAITLSEKMYAGSSVVTSKLVDSYAWDTILAWYKKTGVDCSESTSYGNYLNSKLSLKNMLYAVHIYHDGTSTTANPTDDKSGWKSYASKYTIGTIDVPARSSTPGTDRTLYELPTGALDMTKKNNIYDLAGNMWEWTTETGEHKIKDANGNSVDDGNGAGTHAVRRGGGFNYGGGNGPVAYRNGDYSASGCSVNVGFRVVLYITQ